MNKRLRAAAWLLACLLGLTQIYKNRFKVWADGVSYLDIADAYLRGDWAAVVNACWSPFYSWVLAAVLYGAQPSAYWELMTVKLTGLGVYLVALWAFEQVLRELIRARTEARAAADAPAPLLSDWMLQGLGYCLFLWASVGLILVDRESPDMLVSVFVYGASALVLRIVRLPWAWRNYAAFGVLLGVAYLVKSSMLPLAAVFMLAAVSRQLPLRILLPRMALAAALVVLIAAPWVTLLSLQKERFTFGDAGRLNYAWYISPFADDEFWRGLPASTGTAVHAPRVALDVPEILEFAQPVAGSYPIWYDPSYWNEGLKARFDWKAEIHVLRMNVIALWRYVLGFGVFALFVVFGLVGRAAIDPRRWGPAGRLMWPALAGIGGYMFFTDISAIAEDWGPLQLRYVAPFIPLLFLAMSGGLLQATGPGGERAALLRALTLAVMVCTSVQLSFQVLWARPSGRYFEAIEEHVSWQVASELRQLGLKAGDRVALVGHHDHYGWEEYYWARLAGVKIVASVSMAYWAVDDATQEEARAALQRLDVKALIQPPLPAHRLFPVPLKPWRKLPATPAYVLKLD